MKIDILTIFPEMFNGFINTSIIKRAIIDKLVEINIHNIRDYSKDPHKKVDDYAFGGGAGMVLMPQPIYDAVEDLRKKDTVVILMTPQGETYYQEKAKELVTYKHLLIICGHYEGFDERILDIVDMEISIGDYILTGGEIPSMVITDSVVRLIDGVIEKESHENESFENNLLDYPVYTKPQDFRGKIVPEVLLSGHHENIRKWRLESQIKKTQDKRPDLLEKS
jgi:tRNA (guanine37-N1)-methyltransferase